MTAKEGAPGDSHGQTIVLATTVELYNSYNSFVSRSLPLVRPGSRGVSVVNSGGLVLNGVSKQVAGRR